MQCKFCIDLKCAQLQLGISICSNSDLIAIISRSVVKNTSTSSFSSSLIFELTILCYRRFGRKLSDFLTDNLFLNVDFHQKSFEIKLRIARNRFRGIMWVSRNVIVLYEASSLPDEPKWTGIPLKSWLSMQSVYSPVFKDSLVLGVSRE